MRSTAPTDANQPELYFRPQSQRDGKPIVARRSGSNVRCCGLLKIHPKCAISATIQLIKANSSRWINETEKVAGKFAWQRGHGAFSVSESMLNPVTNYIENQREHHRHRTFEVEYLEFLRLHRVSFDARFVFDDEIVA